MPNEILELIRLKTPIKDVAAEVARNRKFVPMLAPLQELKNKTLFEHLQQNGKLYGLSLLDFITHKLIDLNEVSAINGLNMMQTLCRHDDLESFKLLLLAGIKPTDAILASTEGTNIGTLLRYQPGRNKPSVFELSNRLVPNLNELHNAMLDCADTSDEDSSDEEVNVTEQLTNEELVAYQNNRTQAVARFTERNEGAESLSLIASRGVHFVERHFPRAARDHTFATRNEQHTTYSFSTLFDAGYHADDEPEENDDEISRIHQRNIQFVETLKLTPDKKERNVGSYKAPATRNNKVFENLFWREIQVYINSYNSLFTLRSISFNFGFASNNNPHVSLSWKTKVGGMYGSGVRFGWVRGERRDPHYRRYDGKPKHPNMGYIDMYELPIDYVRNHGVDRLLAYNGRKIDLSNLHLAEAEVIFHSMIPKDYHISRFIITLPSFNKAAYVADVDKTKFGMQEASSFTKAKQGLFSAIRGKKKEKAYQDWVTKRSEHAVDAQSVLIDNTVAVRLFRNGKVRVYDHGDSIAAELPTPNH
jgi:hypothetical protein